jgi:hypothetical protein
MWDDRKEMEKVEPPFREIGRYGVRTVPVRHERAQWKREVDGQRKEVD